MSDRICLRARPGEIEIVVAVAGALADYGLWRPGAPDGLGDLHRGRVSAIVPSLGGVFVRLEGEPDGFLPDRDVSSTPSVGSPIGVRIVRSPHAGKGPKLTARLDTDELEATDGEMRRVRRGPSPLEDVLLAYPELPVAISDPGLAASLTAQVGQRAVASDCELGPAIEDEIASLREPVIAFPGGARASLWPTPALTAIDVDTSGASGTRAPKQVAQLALNRALLPRLLHEVRLRNLSGAILVDLAGLAARKRALLKADFERALAVDPLRPRLLGFTSLGLAEIVRVRRRPALHELSQVSYAGALAAAAALAAAQADDPHRAFALRVSPDLGRLLEADREIGRDLARGSGRPLILQADASLGARAWKVVEISARPAP